MSLALGNLQVSEMFWDHTELDLDFVVLSGRILINLEIFARNKQF